MSCIYVETKTNKYPIYFKNGFSDLKAAVEETGLSGRKLCLIADSNTGKLYAEKVKKELEGSFEEIYVCDIRYFDLYAPDFIKENGITDVLFTMCTFSAVGENAEGIKNNLLSE